MSDRSRDEQERISKINEAALYDIGYHYANQTCDDMDALLKDYEDVEVPESLDKWFDTYPSTRQSTSDKASPYKKHHKFTRWAAVLVVALIIPTLIATIGVEANRVKFFNVVMDVKDKFSTVKVQSDVSITPFDEGLIPDEWTTYYRPTYLPGEYQLREVSGDEVSKMMVFSDSDNTIKLLQVSAETNIQLDTEKAGAMAIDLNGQEGIMVNKNGFITIYWHLEGVNFILTGEVNPGTMVEIAKGVKKQP